jgi:hypothetical protein
VAHRLNWGMDFWFFEVLEAGAVRRGVHPQ